LIKPVTGLFLIFWGLVKVFQGCVLFDGGNDFGVAVIVFGLLAALVGGLFLRDSLR
jgi:succinate-acetate transporter protein